MSQETEERFVATLESRGAAIVAKDPLGTDRLFVLVSDCRCEECQDYLLYDRRMISGTVR